ncbi:MAG: cytochrome c-type biogenesis protein CcmH [Porticoccaceae bacterium]|nr:cytochrome c-type biogenesis protein CcmH [Porticoccaceae bacterium]
MIVLKQLIKAFFILNLIVASTALWAVIEIAPLSNETLEGRYRELIEELRCPKCQNQNLADSDSPIAADLREQVRVLLEEGKSDEEIVAYLVHRYGDFVRYRPAVQKTTMVLWFAPALFLLCALVVIVVVVKTYRRPKILQGELSELEQNRLEALMSAKESGKTTSDKEDRP